jgi:hypothetical protein
MVPMFNNISIQPGSTVGQGKSRREIGKTPCSDGGESFVIDFARNGEVLYAA